MNSDLFKKYDVPGPRYTSYPTVPYWDSTPERAAWLGDLRSAAAKARLHWSLYLHLPYCESRCWFCACNATGTRDHAVEAPYVDALLAEFGMYLESVPELREAHLKQLHLGGGTPTFFSAENLDRLLSSIRNQVSIEAGLDASIEVNPGLVSSEQLNMLVKHGFRRISFGVQDFDKNVQRAIHRGQSPMATENLLSTVRTAGFESVNFDLIYGLPLQTSTSMAQTAAITVKLRPDRIALYSFALVPWIQPAHRKLAENAPGGQEKRKLYEICRETFLSAGYTEIGMDHFALPQDSLAEAAAKGTLHRNFMGYTDYHTTVLLGLGASAISESPGCYHQNEKDVASYQQSIQQGRLPTMRGHVLTDEDKRIRKKILSLMTTFAVEFQNEPCRHEIEEALKEMLEDGLVEMNGSRLRLSAKGRPFLRNACMAFDLRMRRKEPQRQLFSQTV